MEDYNRRFARAPANSHDAHRPLQDGEDLSFIFTWQEDRTLSRNLTVHFKSVTYLVEPGPSTLPLGGKRVRVHEWEDGRVEIHAGAGGALPYRRFDQNPNVTQGAIVENKRLGVALATIQSAQIARDRMRLESKKLTLRTKARIKAAREEADRPPTPEAEKNGYPKAGVAFLDVAQAMPGRRPRRARRRSPTRRWSRGCNASSASAPRD